MAELQPPEVPVNAVTTSPTAIASAPTDNNIIISNHHSSNNMGPNLAPKRQRRPSVRLGEIGGEPPPATLPYDSYPRRPKSWRFHRDPNSLAAAKSSKIRPLTNLVNGGGDYLENPESEDTKFGSRKSKLRKPVKRVRTNWAAAASRIDNGVEMDTNNTNTEEFRVSETEGSESPLREQSPVHSIDNVAELDFWNRSRLARARVSESNSRGDRNNGLDDGVRDWLIGLGLSRYAPIFEIHEVDDEVLPMLTLEDLKDMGINAVGSRRKMYTSILKLRKGFS